MSQPEWLVPQPQLVYTLVQYQTSTCMCVCIRTFIIYCIPSDMCLTSVLLGSMKMIYTELDNVIQYAVHKPFSMWLIIALNWENAFKTGSIVKLDMNCPEISPTPRLCSVWAETLQRSRQWDNLIRKCNQTYNAINTQIHGSIIEWDINTTSVTYSWIGQWYFTGETREILCCVANIFVTWLSEIVSFYLAILI